MSAVFQIDLRVPAQFSEGGTVQRGPFIRTVSVRIDGLIHYLYLYYCSDAIVSKMPVLWY